MNEDFEGLRVPKETGDPDEQLLEQRIEFMRIRQHEPEILSHVLDLVHVHPAFDTPVNRVLFIKCKIVPGSVAQEDEDFTQRLRPLVFRERQSRPREAPRVRQQRL